MLPQPVGLSHSCFRQYLLALVRTEQLPYRFVIRYVQHPEIIAFVLPFLSKDVKSTLAHLVVAKFGT